MDALLARVRAEPNRLGRENIEHFLNSNYLCGNFSRKVYLFFCVGVRLGDEGLLRLQRLQLRTQLKLLEVGVSGTS